MSEKYDVIVVGGGNAALCAALAAREAGARVLVLERSPEHERGGNTRHTRNIRCTHAAADQFFSGPYSEEEHLQDLIGVTGGPANLDLAKLAVRESSQLPAWMSGHGVHWQQPLGRDAAFGAHEPMVSGRRQGHAQHVLPDGGAHGNRGPLQRAGGRTRHRE